MNTATMTPARRIAKPGQPISHCYECGYGYSEKVTEILSHLFNANRKFNCKECNAEHDSLTDFDVWVREDNAQFLDLECTQNATWYHATNNPNWATEILESNRWTLPGGTELTADLMVHLGTKETAIARATQRAEDLFVETEVFLDEWFMFEVTLNPNAPIHPDVQDDLNCFPEHSLVTEKEEYWDWESRGVTRYVNAYEEEGSISLLVNSRAFTVQSVAQFSVEFPSQ